MSSAGFGQHAAERDDLQRLDGIERVPLLSRAHMIAIAPGAVHDERSDDPTYVFIEWDTGVVERPYPGSAIWRAVLEHSLAQWADTSSHGLLRSKIETDLAQFPSLEAWLHWRDQERVVPDSP